MIRSISLDGPAPAATIERMRRELTLVIPAYRCARYLPAAVASALHAPVARVLIAEDAGGDGTAAAARECARRHPDRVAVRVNERRRGTASNMNLAMGEVQTPFAAKLDGDDVLIPGYLERAFHLICSSPGVAVVSGRDLRIASEEALEFDPELAPHARPHIGARLMSGTDAYRFIVAWSPNPCSSGAIYRMTAFQRIGGFDEKIGWGEDWEIWLRFARDWTVAYCDAVSALYRIHPASSTATETRNNRLCFGYDYVYRRAAEMCPDPEFRPALRQAFLKVVKWYLGAASRQARTSAGDSIVCLGRACRALGSAFAL